MFEQYFNFLRTPFARDIPEKELYCHPGLEELCSRLEYVARNRLFAVVTGDVGRARPQGSGGWWPPSTSTGTRSCI